MTPRAASTSFSCSFKEPMRRRIWRRSVSSLVSPGPRVPMPPPSRDRAVPWPPSLGSKYRSWASSTCSLPSLLRARWAKMSKIRVVRSMTRTWQAFSRLRIWVGVSSRSNSSRSISSCRHSSAACSTMPEPRQVAVSGAGRFWVRVSTGSAPAVRESSSSSRRDAWASNSPVSKDTSRARWGRVSFSYKGIPSFFKGQSL